MIRLDVVPTYAVAFQPTRRDEEKAPPLQVSHDRNMPMLSVTGGTSIPEVTAHVCRQRSTARQTRLYARHHCSARSTRDHGRFRVLR